MVASGATPQKSEDLRREGTMEQKSIECRPSGRNKHRQEEQMALWGEIYTNYATAQLYSQMVTTKLNQY